MSPLCRIPRVKILAIGAIQSLAVPPGSPLYKCKVIPDRVHTLLCATLCNIALPESNKQDSSCSPRLCYQGVRPLQSEADTAERH